MDAELAGLITHGQRAHRDGDLAAAEAAYRRVLADDPDQPDALHYLGVLTWQRGDAGGALELVTRARRRAPQDAALASNLGLVLRSLERDEEAERAFREAVTLRPDHAEAWYNLGLLCADQARHAEAADCQMRALAAMPGHAQAAWQRGLALAALKRPAEAVEALALARRLDPSQAGVLIDLAAAREAMGELETAVSLLEQLALADTALRARALARQSLLLKRLGRPASALAAARAAAWADADEPDAQRALGLALKEQARLPAAVAAFRRGHALLRTPGSAQGARLTFRRTTRAKLRHDADQFRWLAAQGAGEGFAQWAADAAALLAALPGAPDGAVLPLPARPDASAWYNRAVHLEEAPRLSGGALNPALDAAAIEADYFARGPGITWVDELLRPEALAALRRYCLASTVWYDFDHVNGYVGAYLEDGFACPLLIQIAEELPRRLPRIFGRHPLLQLWAYKYDSRLAGIDMHADFAAVNVNFWITPDEANLDPAGGGLRVWDREAPAGWTRDDYNSYDPGAQQRIRRFLADSGATELRIPHRANRCVIFNSDLFHQTDEIRFAPGYAERRINITLLYGRRGAA